MVHADGPEPRAVGSDEPPTSILPFNCVKACHCAWCSFHKISILSTAKYTWSIRECQEVLQNPFEQSCSKIGH